MRSPQLAVKATRTLAIFLLSMVLGLYPLPVNAPYHGEPNFTLSASPSSQTVRVGGSVNYTITVSANSLFSGSVTLSASGAPSGVMTSFNPNPVSVRASYSSTSILKVSTAQSSPIGAYTITISGVGGGITRSTNLTLAIEGIPVEFDSAVFIASAKVTKDLGDELRVSFDLKTTAGSAKFDYVVTVKQPDQVVLYPITKKENVTVSSAASTNTVSYTTTSKKGTWTALVQVLKEGVPVDFKALTFNVT